MGSEKDEVDKLIAEGKVREASALARKLGNEPHDVQLRKEQLARIRWENAKSDNPDLAAETAREIIVEATPKIEAEAIEKTRKEITIAANEAMRLNIIQCIIETRASELWKRKPSFNDCRTATGIRDSVREDLKYEEIPHGWELANESERDSVKKEIDRTKSGLPAIG